MWSKSYGQVIIIAARYNFFRKQGLGDKNQERNILDYQTQQEKVIPRIAEHFAMAVASQKLMLLGSENRQKVIKNDFSLLKETHSTLACFKCLFS